MPKAEPANLTERLVAASVEAKNTLREIQIANADTRKLLREVKEVQAVTARKVEEMVDAFKDRADVAIREATPTIHSGIEGLIERNSHDMEKSMKQIIDNTSGQLIQLRKHLDEEITDARADLLMVTRATNEARAQGDATARLARGLAETLDRLSEHFERIESGAEPTYVRIYKDEQGNVTVQSVKESAIELDVDATITHLGDEPNVD